MGIKSIVLKNLVSKPFTKRYPKEKLKPYPKFRGKIEFDKEKCIGCGLCKAYCPTKAIRLKKQKKTIKTKAGIHTQFSNFIHSVDLTKCMRCGLCVDVCPVKIIYFTNEFELAGDKKEELVSEK